MVGSEVKKSDDLRFSEVNAVKLQRTGNPQYGTLYRRTGGLLPVRPIPLVPCTPATKFAPCEAFGAKVRVAGRP